MRLCSSQVLNTGEVALPPVLEELPDDVFASQLAPRSNGSASATATAPSSTTATLPSTTDTAPDTDSGAKDHQGLKRPVASSDTSYSQEHRTNNAGPSNYPKRPNRPRALISSEEDEPPPRLKQQRSPGSDYSQGHRATAEDRHCYPKRHLRGHLLTLSGRQ